MKIHEIREMKNEELLNRIAEEEKNLIDLRFALQLKQLTNTAKIGLIKRDIAKMKTILRERELSALKETEGANKG